MRKNGLRWAAAVALVGLVGACAGQGLQKAQNAEPQGDAFTKGLYEGYVELAAAEFREGDYEDSDVFASQAIAAAGGNPGVPADFDFRVIAERDKPTLASARDRLVAALNATASQKAPAAAARAQVMFDCWMQEQEENLQLDHIEACRDAFYAALRIAEEAVIPVAVPEPAPPPPPEPAFESRTFVIYFAFDSNILTEEGLVEIIKAADYAKAFPDSRIEAVGHADRAGTEEYNLGLGTRRAITAQDALVGLGLSRSRITTDSLGEREPAKPTADGVREPLNRRAVLYVVR